MEKRKFLRLRLKIRLSCSDLHYIFHILNSIGGPLGPMVQTSPSAQSDRSRTIKKIIKPVWTNGPLDRSGPVVLSLGADHRAPCSSKSTPVADAFAERRLFVTLDILCEIQRVPENRGSHARLLTFLIGLTFDCPASTKMSGGVLSKVHPFALPVGACRTRTTAMVL